MKEDKHEWREVSDLIVRKKWVCWKCGATKKMMHYGIFIKEHIVAPFDGGCNRETPDE